MFIYWFSNISILITMTEKVAMVIFRGLTLLPMPTGERRNVWVAKKQYTFTFFSDLDMNLRI